MNIESSIQSFKSGEKQVISQALYELIDYLAQGPSAQEEVIQYLPENNIMMILDYLADPDAQLRRLTAKFLLDLLHNNYLVQLVFCDILGVIPCDGKICLTSVPDSFKVVTKFVPECLETLKQSSVEEKNDELPYCWYLHVQNADKPEKRITFVPNSDKEGLILAYPQFDPLYSIIGFVMRCPKRESNSKIVKSRLSEIVKPMTTQTSVELGSMNISLNQSQQALADSLLQQKGAGSMSVSISRKHMSKSPMVGLPHISAKSMRPGNLTMMTPTSAQLKTEKDQNRTMMSTSETPIEPGSAASDKKIVTRVVFKKMSEDRKSGTRKTEPNIDLFDGVHALKLNSSINDGNDNEIKLTTQENSLNNSVVSRTKASTTTPSSALASKAKPQTTQTSKSNNAKIAAKTGADKTMTHREKELSSILTTDEMNISQYGKQKSSELEKKSSLRTPKGAFNSMSAANKSVPNTTLLNKILKAKPLPKEKSHTLSQSIHHSKHDPNKGSFWDFIYAYRKINANTLSSVISTTNKSAKTPVNQPTSAHASKKQEQEKYSSSTAQISKFSTIGSIHKLLEKRTIHASMMQHTVEPNSSLSNRYEALDDELSLEMTPKDNPHSARRMMNSVVSSRASQEVKKETVAAIGKFMSPRKSHDVTYLATHKKKVTEPSSVVAKDLKNKKTNQKKINQTVVHESVQVK